MSPRSAESHWVDCELARAIEFKKHIFPLLLEGSVWFQVTNKQSVNVKGGKLPPDNFFDRIRAVLGNEAKVSFSRNEVKQEAVKEPQNLPVDLGNDITLEMVKIPGGSFLMGTEDKEIKRLRKQHSTDWFNDEKPQHKVTIESFYMGKYLVTQEQWRAIATRTDLKVSQDLEPNPAYF